MGTSLTLIDTLQEKLSVSAAAIPAVVSRIPLSVVPRNWLVANPPLPPVPCRFCTPELPVNMFASNAKLSDTFWANPPPTITFNCSSLKVTVFMVFLSLIILPCSTSLSFFSLPDLHDLTIGKDFLDNKSIICFFNLTFFLKKLRLREIKVLDGLGLNSPILRWERFYKFTTPSTCHASPTNRLDADLHGEAARRARAWMPECV